MTNNALLLHEQRKRVAEAAIDIVLGSVEHGLWRQDDWVVLHLVDSLNSLLYGRYDLAKVEAIKAATPLAERSRRPLPRSPRISLTQMRRALRAIQAMPAREHPAFC
jgi:dihydrodipicolinate synthase/N-acetylneuraminate lyase